MKIMVYDLETTGFLEDPKARITEIAWAVYDTEHKRIVKVESEMVCQDTEDNNEVPEEAREVTGINKKLLDIYGLPLDRVLRNMMANATVCDAYMASNGELFDMPMLRREFKKIDTEPVQLPCIDDRFDVPYHDYVKGFSLSHKAADHGFLNPFAHWGIGDVLTYIKVFELGGYSWQDAYESAKSPLKEVIAMVSFHEKQKAKDAGFRWDPDRKVWWKIMRAHQTEHIKDFQVKVKDYVEPV